MSIQATSRPTREDNKLRSCGYCGRNRQTSGRKGESYCMDCIPLARELGWAPPKTGNRKKKP